MQNTDTIFDQVNISGIHFECLMLLTIVVNSHTENLKQRKHHKLISINNDFFDGNDCSKLPQKTECAQSALQKVFGGMHCILCCYHFKNPKFHSVSCCRCQPPTATKTVRFRVIMMETAQNTVFWDMTPYNLVESHYLILCVCVCAP
jgi:hypothetical protein